MAEEVFRINEPRAIEVLSKIGLGWRNRTGIFHDMVPPEEYLISALPEGTDPLIQAQLLFAYIKLNLSGERAWTLVRQCARLFVEAPWLVRPDAEHLGDYNLFFTQRDHFQSIVRFSKGMRPELFDWWVSGIQILKGDGIDSDPRNLIYQSDGTREGLIRSFSRFKGIAHKIAQLQVIAFHGWARENDPKLWDYFENVAEPFLAIDVWWMRLMYQFGLIDQWSSDRRDDISRTLSDRLCDLCKQIADDLGISYLDISQGVWHLGSLVCGQKRLKSGSLLKQALWCFANCPANSFCRYFVRSDEGETSRHGIGWASACRRFRILRNPQINLGLEGGVGSQGEKPKPILAELAKPTAYVLAKRTKSEQVELDLDP